MSMSIRVLGAILVGFGAGGAALAQCPPFLQPFENTKSPFFSGKVFCSTMWDPDGPGPRSPVLVVGGELQAYDGTSTNIAAFDPETGLWSGFGKGLRFFDSRTDVPLWASSIHALTVLPGGELVAGGMFDLRGRQLDDGISDAQCLAKWNVATAQWEPLGTFSGSPTIRALALHPDGSLFVGGEFGGVDGVAARCVARWLAGRFPGTFEPWIGYGNGLVPGDSVRALHCMSDGNTYAGGNLALGNLAKINSIWPFTWEVAGSGTDGTVESLDEYNGQLLVSGTFAKSKGASPVELNGIGWYHPSSGWSTLGTGMVGSSVHAARTLSNGQVIAAGDFSSAGGVPASGVARWNGSAWSVMGTGVNRLNETKDVKTIAYVSNSQVYIAGDFSRVGDAGTPLGVAAWNGAQWKPLDNFFEAGGPVVYALARSYSTPNPTASHSIFVAGEFANAAATNSTNILRLEMTFQLVTQRWFSSRNPLAGGTNGPVYAMAKLGGAGTTAQVVAAGNFTSAGGINASNIAIWNGSAWQALGSGINGPVYALLAQGPNSIIAAGDFTNAGGVAVQNIAMWNGSAWSAIGNAGTNGPVRSLAWRSAGGFYLGGSFTRLANMPVNRFGLWNGTQWAAPSIPPPGITSEVRSMAYYPYPVDLVKRLALAQAAPGYLQVYLEDIDSWTEIVYVRHVDTPMADKGILAAYPVQTLETNNQLFAIKGTLGMWTSAGSGNFPDGFCAGFSQLAGVGTSHKTSSLESQQYFVTDYLAGGDFPEGAIRFGADGTKYPIDFGAGLTSASTRVSKILACPNGDMLAVGRFGSIGGVRVNRIARWTGSAWSPLGSGLSGAGTFDEISTLLSLPNGDILAGGNFSSIGGVSASQIARWNGTTWSTFGTLPANATPTCSIQRPDGTIVLGLKDTGLRYWNGTAWTVQSNVAGSPIDIANAPNGDLVVAGGSATGGLYKVARWNGPFSALVNNWTLLGTGMNGKINAVAVMQNGDVVAGGQFTTAGGVPASNIARWNGSSWVAMGTGFVNPVMSLKVLSTGQLVVGTASQPDPSVQSGLRSGVFAKWNGVTWEQLGYEFDGDILSITELADGDAILAGDFGGGYSPSLTAVASPSLMRYSSTGANVAITSQPTSSTICDSIAASVAVAADSNAPMNYQWQVQTAPGTWVNASNSTTLPCGGQISVSSPTSKGTQVSITRCPGVAQYQLRCLVSNSCSTITSNSVTIKLCLADLDCNMYVDDSDFVQFASAYDTFLCNDPSMPAGCHADLNGDNYVDDADFVQFANAYDLLTCQ